MCLPPSSGLRRRRRRARLAGATVTCARWQECRSSRAARRPQGRAAAAVTCSGSSRRSRPVACASERARCAPASGPRRPRRARTTGRRRSGPVAEAPRWSRCSLASGLRRASVLARWTAVARARWQGRCGSRVPASGSRRRRRVRTARRRRLCPTAEAPLQSHCSPVSGPRRRHARRGGLPRSRPAARAPWRVRLSSGFRRRSCP